MTDQIKPLGDDLPWWTNLVTTSEKLSNDDIVKLRDLWRQPNGKHPYLEAAAVQLPKSNNEPLPIILHCPMCHVRHIDEGEFATIPHHTHACQDCGHCWRPAIAPTVGVRFLPGFKNEPPSDTTTGDA